METLLIRADTSPRVGTGHVMRCLALAQAWQDRDGEAVFAAAALPAALRDRLTREGCDVEQISAASGGPADVLETLRYAARREAEWVVLDGYGYDAGFQQTLKDAGHRVLAMDDYGHAGRYSADLILNQNHGAAAGLYADRASDTRLLLGTRYALLRREFARYQDFRRDIPEVARRILVTLGGSDPDNVTAKVLRALGRVRTEKVEAVVVVGGGNPHRAELEAVSASVPAKVDLRVDVEDMPALMAAADLAIAAGGSTSWERALLGLPSLVVVLADNQREVAARLDEAGVAKDLGRPDGIDAETLAGEIDRLSGDPAARSAMSERGREAVDGRGARRVAAAMVGDPDFRLRRMRAEDVRTVWEMANDPEVRSRSFATAAIPWDEHVRWFAGRLADENCFFYMAVDAADVPIGLVRVEGPGPEAVISVSLSRSARGQGLAAPVIREACRGAVADGLRAGTVAAFVRPENLPSLRAFLRAGFSDGGEAAVRGSTARRLAAAL